ncbi:hypothetical protein RQ734_20275 [Roseomonas mucosa]|uniref:hypothetical protein n=1 Tax=Roseomonas mucosa TaxID=207340 RepID=UPI0028CEADC7|nr:hypothetical protein [Roseomonas mucosa]MDT8278403.1 hypothetical protein [Roseomonas mucosa]
MRDPIFKPLQVPDRFESLLNKDRSGWGSFISPVQESLAILQRLFENSNISSRGQLFVVESRPGYGKTTFLNTASLFLDDIIVDNILPNQPADAVLMDVNNEISDKRKLIVLEGRESIDHVSESELGQLLHQINQRLRSPSCANVVVAWPCNSTKLAGRIAALSAQIGGSALLDDEIGRHHFSGPNKKEFRPRFITAEPDAGRGSWRRRG